MPRSDGGKVRADKSARLTSGSNTAMSWAERAAERSPVVQRSRARGVEQAKAIVEAAQRLISSKGGTFTTQELVKEAGIALQTFYSYFESKDQLLLAVFEHIIDEASIGFKASAEHLEAPVDRLHSYVNSVITGLERSDSEALTPRFITAEHWRLQSLYPAAVNQATRSFTELLREDLDAGVRNGSLRLSADTSQTAWLMCQLILGVYHHYAFAGSTEPYEVVAQRLWEFCASGLGMANP